MPDQNDHTHHAHPGQSPADLAESSSVIGVPPELVEARPAPGAETTNDQGVACRWDDDHSKWVQAGVELAEDDDGAPEFMSLEQDGQEAFDAMWRDGVTVTEDGYR